VFDLRQLRGLTGPPATFSATAHYTSVASVHNIALNEATGFAYLVGSNGGATNCGGGLHMVNVQNPAAPAFAGCFADPLTGRAGTGYTHDVQCVIYAGPHAAYGGREICIGANETALSVSDVTDKSAPVAVSRAGYPTVGYAHQGWLSPYQRYFFLNDELDEIQGSAATTRTVIWDLADLEDPVVLAEYFGPTSATDHNNYVVGTRLYASNYQYGIRVIDISNPAAPSQTGHFDTAPDEPDQFGFGGSWSNYPFFASGIVVVTSRAQGLFVLKVQ
jgi:choice-of-anchor B domain-containing protein